MSAASLPKKHLDLNLPRTSDYVKIVYGLCELNSSVLWYEGIRAAMWLGQIRGGSSSRFRATSMPMKLCAIILPDHLLVGEVVCMFSLLIC